jgi:hypothetical protein
MLRIVLSLAGLLLACAGCGPISPFYGPAWTYPSNYSGPYSGPYIFRPSDPGSPYPGYAGPPSGPGPGVPTP